MCVCLGVCLWGYCCICVHGASATTVSHFLVCGNGSRSGKGVVHYHKDNLRYFKPKSPACMLYCGVKRTHSVTLRCMLSHISA